MRARLLDLGCRALGDPGGIRARMIRGGTGNAGIQAANRLITLLAAILLARTLGADGYGVYAQAMAAAALLQILAEFGTPGLIVRELAAARTRDDRAAMTACLGTAFGLVAAVSAAVVAFAGAAMAAGAGPAGAASAFAFALGLAVVPAAALGRTAAQGLWAFRRVLLGNAIYFLVRPLVVLLLVGAMILGGGALSPAFAVGAQLAGAVVVLGLAAVALWRSLPAGVGVGVGYGVAAWLKSAGPFALTAAAMTVTMQTDVLMLGYFESNDQVGVYRVASQGAVLVAFGLQAVNAVLAPEFTRLHTAGETGKLQKLATQSARYVFAAACPVALAFFIAGDVLAAFVFGPDFGRSHGPLAVLTLGQLVNAALGSAGVLMNMTHNERDSARAVLTAALVNVVLNAALIPFFGLMGAAAATAISVATWNVILYRGAWRRLGIDPSAFGPRKA